jgi:hypothetical protein
MCSMQLSRAITFLPAASRPLPYDGFRESAPLTLDLGKVNAE